MAAIVTETLAERVDRKTSSGFQRALGLEVVSGFGTQPLDFDEVTKCDEKQLNTSANAEAVLLENHQAALFWEARPLLMDLSSASAFGPRTAAAPLSQNRGFWWTRSSRLILFVSPRS